MTRTAILFSGSAYNVRFSLPSILENLVIPNNADVFIVTERRCLRRKTPAGVIPDPGDWDAWLKKNQTQINDLDHPLTDEEIQLMKDTFGDRLKVFYLIDIHKDYLDYLHQERMKMLVAVNDFRRYNMEHGIKPPLGNNIDHPENGNVRCVIDQYNHVKKCYELMCQYENDNGIKYDYVMRARIDFVVPEKISIEYYVLPHDKAYWHIMGSVLREEFPYSDEFCWFSRRSLCEHIYPQLSRLGTIVNRKYETYYAKQDNDFRFGAETQFALLIHELNLPYINVKIDRSARYTAGGDGYDYMNYMFSRNAINVDEEYKLLCRCPSDINEHLPTLRRYAEQCIHITEMGTRYGNSTVAFMSSYPQKMIAYDVTFNDRIEYLQMIAKDCSINFHFRLENVHQIEIEETDLLFIDTNHNVESISLEITKHSPKCKKYIILHDTVAFYNRGQGYDDGGGGMALFLEPWINDPNCKWQLKEHFENNNGLTVYERIKPE